MRSSLDRFFSIRARGSSFETEVRAGTTTFLTVAYILFVNPQILSEAGLPASDVALATALASALATLVMGCYAHFPFALAPGMGLNAYFTFGVVQGMGVSYQVALAAVFIEGLLFLAMAAGGIREAIVNAIPSTLKTATMCGIGLFLAIIGFQGAELTVESASTLLTRGDVRSPSVLLALGGLLLTGVLMARRVTGALLLGILAVTGVAWATGLAAPPPQIMSWPGLPEETLLAFDFSPLFTGELITVVLAFLFVDFFDTAGTLVGVGRLGGFLDEEGNLPRAHRAFTADAVGTTAGAMLGTSTVTTYIESATGIEEGGRTGLTAVTAGVLFLLSLFFAPIFTAIPAAATAPALIIVGALMMQGAREIAWNRIEEALPAFLTIAAMPFTYSIASGIALGIVTHVLLYALSGKAREVHTLMYTLAVLLILYYGLTGGAG